MSRDFLNSGQGADSAQLQHLKWFLAHPEVWFTFFLWLIILIAIGKVIRLLRRHGKTLWLIGFVVIAAAALFYYVRLSMEAVDFYAQGRIEALYQLRIAKRVVIALSAVSAFWIIRDWVKKQATR